jgi:hypothetical protein
MFPIVDFSKSFRLFIYQTFSTLTPLLNLVKQILGVMIIVHFSIHAGRGMYDTYRIWAMFFPRTTQNLKKNPGLLRNIFSSKYVQKENNFY